MVCSRVLHPPDWTLVTKTHYSRHKRPRYNNRTHIWRHLHALPAVSAPVSPATMVTQALRLTSPLTLAIKYNNKQ